jgi:hypothetical protein
LNCWAPASQTCAICPDIFDAILGEEGRKGTFDLCHIAPGTDAHEFEIWHDIEDELTRGLFRANDCDRFSEGALQRMRGAGVDASLAP